VRRAGGLGGDARAGELWDKYSLALLLLGLALLLLVLIPGPRRQDQRRAPLDAHRPDEFPGVGARQGAGADLGVQLLRAQARRARNHLPRLAQARGSAGRGGVLLLLEPDFGATTVLFATGFAVLFVAGARLRYVLCWCRRWPLAFACWR
jgi:cell division protein FtsW